MVFPPLPVNMAEQDEAPAAGTVALLLCPSLHPPTCCQCVRRVFVWRCFDRQCLCVWAVLAGRRACPVQSWWRAKCSLRVGCAFHSAQPPWTPSRQTAAGGTPLPLSFSSPLTYTHTHREPASTPHVSFLFFKFPSSIHRPVFPFFCSLFLLLQRLFFSQIKCKDRVQYFYILKKYPSYTSILVVAFWWWASLFLLSSSHMLLL